MINMTVPFDVEVDELERIFNLSDTPDDALHRAARRVIDHVKNNGKEICAFNSFAQ